MNLPDPGPPERLHESACACQQGAQHRHRRTVFKHGTWQFVLLVAGQVIAYVLHRWLD